MKPRSLFTAICCSLALAACATDDVSDDIDDSPDATPDAIEDIAANDVDPAVLDTALVVTPTGLVDRDCVQAIGTGELVDENGTVTRTDGTTYTLPPCAGDTMPLRAEILQGVADADAGIEKTNSDIEPTDNGWIEAAWWHAPRWMKHMSGNFVVPPAPSNKGSQTIFFFPSFEPHAGNAIIQPVLQWGSSAAGGGKYWAIASWYVGPHRTVHGPLKRVNVGDKLAGTIAGAACTSGGKCTWTITTKDTTHSATSQIKVKTGEVYTEVQGGVLEAYSVDHCNKYPSNGVEAFFNLAVKDGAGHAVTPHFSKMFWHTTCHESQVVGPKTVFLNWN